QSHRPTAKVLCNFQEATLPEPQGLSLLDHIQSHPDGGMPRCRDLPECWQGHRFEAGNRARGCVPTDWSEKTRCLFRNLPLRGEPEPDAWRASESRVQRGVRLPLQTVREN